MHFSKSKLFSILETFAYALVGALIFNFISFPLPWLLGPLTSLMMVKAFTKRLLYWPVHLHNLAIFVIAFFLGTSFSMDTFKNIGQHLPTMVLMTVLLILFTILLAFAVTFLSKSSFESILIGSMPGGLTQMMILGEELKNVDVTIVTLMQMVRVIMIIFLVPFLTIHVITGEGFSAADLMQHGGTQERSASVTYWYSYLFYFTAMLAGLWLALRLRVPTPYLMGPLVATICLIALGLPAPELPSPLFIMTQVFIGTRIGCQTEPRKLISLKKLGLYTLLSNIVLILFTFMLALLLLWWFPISLATGFLSTAAGGVAEMGITAAVVHADLSIITGYQLFRIFFILLVVPPFLKWWILRRERQALKNQEGRT